MTSQNINAASATTALKAVCFSLVILLCGGTIAQASDWGLSSNEDPTYYVSLGGAGAIDIEFEDSNLGEGESVGNGYGVNLAGGTKAKYFGGEFQLEYLNGFNVDGGAFAKDYDMLSFTINMKAYLPLGPVEPFLLVGGGANVLWANTDLGNKSYLGGAIRGGAGLSVHFTDHWGITAQASYVLTTNETRDADYVSANIGVLYSF